MSASFMILDPTLTAYGALQSFLNSFISMFVMVDPFAAIPIYLVLTQPLTQKQTLQTTKKCVLVASGILLFFAFTGVGLLSFFRISLAALRIAGGLLLLKFAFEQMSGSREKIKSDEETESLQRDSIAIVPLAMPLLAGPGSISTVIVQSANTKSVEVFCIYILALGCVMWASYLIIRSSRHLFRILGKTGLNLLEKLMGILVAAIAIQFIITGIRESFPSV